MDSKEKIKEPEYEVINISSILDLAKYKKLTEYPEYDKENVRFKINKQLIKEQVYEVSTNKNKLKDLLRTSKYNILLELKRFCELYEDYNSIGEDSELKTFDQLDQLKEQDIIKREPLDKVIDYGDLDLLNIFKTYIEEENSKLYIASDKYDE